MDLRLGQLARRVLVRLAFLLMMVSRGVLNIRAFKIFLV